MAVDPTTVDYVASLAKLRLSEEERRRMVEDLGRILEYVEQIQQLDLSEVPPTKHVIEILDVARSDEARPSLPRETALANAPETAHHHFAVPKVLPD